MTNPFQQTSNARYSEFIALSRYARYDDTLERRETWGETCQRWAGFWIERHPDLTHQITEAMEAIYNLEVMPSMRSLMTAGRALDRDHVAGYNCAYTPIESIRDFDEIMYILLCGTGVGFSVERQYVQRLPEVSEEFHRTDSTITFSDSKIGWASGFRELLALLYAGKIPAFDFGRIRPSGSPLKTFGGRASGPEPLRELCEFTVNLFTNAAGRRLTSLECHDLVCKIAEIVVVGGVRRSALISLSNLSDDRMRNCKSGNWWEHNPQRALANNSYVATERPDFNVFLNEWVSLYESKSGERGIFSRVASQKATEGTGRRDPGHEFGTNPCSEIILRGKQFCNLSEIVVRPDDDAESLARKARIAAFIGTLQSTLTDFRYLRKKWKENCDEERLLGVSLTGIMDHPVLSKQFEYDDMPAHPDHGGKLTLSMFLEELRDVVVETNAQWAEQLGIPQSAATTCVKPSGTVSQLVDSASGIHPRFARYYIRTVRNDVKDPLTTFMIDKGFPYEQDVMNPNNMVFSFPMKSPDTAVTNDETDGMEQVKLWQVYQDAWCEHKPSMTAYYNDGNFLEIGSWIYNNFDKVSGISFLPVSDHVYRQAPYQKIMEEEYNELIKEMPTEVDWTELAAYEKGDNTTASQELACKGGACEV